MKLFANLLVVILFFAFAGCTNTPSKVEENSDADNTAIEEQPQSEMDPQSAEEPLVKISTTFGNITIKLYNKTPLHRDNFLKLVKEGYYDGLLFHRVIQEFMIQGGDPDSKNAAPNVELGQGGPGYTIPAEIRPDLIHKKGALAAARMGDHMNPQKASSGSQFYIVQGKVYPLEELEGIEQRHGIAFSQIQKESYSSIGGAPHLDGGYTVFGEVIEGLNVIDAIAALKTDGNNRPVKDVKMKIEVIRDVTSPEIQ